METKHSLDNTFGTITRKMDDLERRVAQLEGDNGAKYLKYSAENVSNPPTAAELTGLFGTPGSVGNGFIVIINDNAAGTNEYLVWSDGTNWFYLTGTKAV